LDNDELNLVFQSISKAYQKKWGVFFGEGEQDQEAAIAKLDLLATTLGVAKPKLDMSTGAAIFAYSTRADNQAIPFCKPELVDNSTMPFAHQYNDGYNIAVYQDIGSERYIPQNLFYDVDRKQFMGLPDLHNAEGISYGDRQIQILELAGVNGSGKTRVIQGDGQMQLLYNIIGRVPARVARFSSTEPQRIIASLQPVGTEGELSTFMNQAKHLAEVIASMKPGSIVYLDEPGGGTDYKETAAIVSALGYLAAQRQCYLVLTNHEEEADRNWERLDKENAIPWYPIGYQYSEDPQEQRKLRYGQRFGAESIRIAEQMGVNSKTIELAEFLVEVRAQLENHKRRIRQQETIAQAA